jgi:hypothetical protein
MLLPKRYKIIKTATGLRLTLPFSVGWNETDYVDIEQIDSDTLIIKRKKLE